MSEQLLDDAQVGAALEQMGRERVAQRVRADPVREARRARRGLDRAPCLLPRQAAATLARGTPVRRVAGCDVAERQEPRPRAVEPSPEPVEGHVADRDEPLLVALADDAHEPAVDREVLACRAGAPR